MLTRAGGLGGWLWSERGRGEGDQGSKWEPRWLGEEVGGKVSQKAGVQHEEEGAEKTLERKIERRVSVGGRENRKEESGRGTSNVQHKVGHGCRAPLHGPNQPLQLEFC